MTAKVDKALSALYQETVPNGLRLREYGPLHAIVAKDGTEQREFVIVGYASPQVVDREKHLIKREALAEDLPRFLAHPKYRNANIVHSNIQVAEVLPEWTNPDTGEKWTTHVDEVGLFCIIKLRTDKYRPKICERVEEDILNGKLNSFSISGDAPFESRHYSCSNGTCFWIIDKIELYEITICEEGVNPDAKFSVVSKADAMRLSQFCSDGTCPINLGGSGVMDGSAGTNTKGEVAEGAEGAEGLTSDVAREDPREADQAPHGQEWMSKARKPSMIREDVAPSTGQTLNTNHPDMLTKTFRQRVQDYVAKATGGTCKACQNGQHQRCSGFCDCPCEQKLDESTSLGSMDNGISKPKLSTTAARGGMTKAEPVTHDHRSDAASGGKGETKQQLLRRLVAQGYSPHEAEVALNDYTFKALPVQRVGPQPKRKTWRAPGSRGTAAGRQFVQEGIKSQGTKVDNHEDSQGSTEHHKKGAGRDMDQEHEDVARRETEDTAYGNALGRKSDDPAVKEAVANLDMAPIMDSFDDVLDQYGGDTNAVFESEQWEEALQGPTDEVWRNVSDHEFDQESDKDSNLMLDIMDMIESEVRDAIGKDEGDDPWEEAITAWEKRRDAAKSGSDNMSSKASGAKVDNHLDANGGTAHHQGEGDPKLTHHSHSPGDLSHGNEASRGEYSHAHAHTTPLHGNKGTIRNAIELPENSEPTAIQKGGWSYDAGILKHVENQDSLSREPGQDQSAAQCAPGRGARDLAGEARRAGEDKDGSRLEDESAGGLGDDTWAPAPGLSGASRQRASGRRRPVEPVSNDYWCTHALAPAEGQRRPERRALALASELSYLAEVLLLEAKSDEQRKKDKNDYMREWRKKHPSGKGPGRPTVGRKPDTPDYDPHDKKRGGSGKKQRSSHANPAQEGEHAAARDASRSNPMPITDPKERQQAQREQEARDRGYGNPPESARPKMKMPETDRTGHTAFDRQREQAHGASRFDQYGQGPDDQHVTEFEDEDLNDAELKQKIAALEEDNNDEEALRVKRVLHDRKASRMPGYKGSLHEVAHRPGGPVDQEKKDRDAKNKKRYDEIRQSYPTKRDLVAAAKRYGISSIDEKTPVSDIISYIMDKEGAFPREGGRAKPRRPAGTDAQSRSDRAFARMEATLRANPDKAKRFAELAGEIAHPPEKKALSKARQIAKAVRRATQK